MVTGLVLVGSLVFFYEQDTVSVQESTTGAGGSLYYDFHYDDDYLLVFHRGCRLRNKSRAAQPEMYT